MKSIYSRQLIDELSKNLNPEIIDFFEMKKELFHFPIDTIPDLIDDALDTHFVSYKSREDLIGVIAKIKNAKKQKKKRWYESYQNDLSLPKTDKNYSFYFYLQLWNSMPLSEYRSFYKNKSKDELIAEKMEEVEKWKSNTKSLLISFPRLNPNQFTSANIYKSLLCDVVLDIWNYIDKNLGGNIYSFIRQMPEDFIEHPIFSPTSYNVELQNIDGVYKDVLLDENGETLLELSVNSDKDIIKNPIKILDKTDQEIVSILINNATNSFYQDKKIRMDFQALANMICTGRPSGVFLDKLEDRLLNLTEYNHKARKKKQVISLNFFDNIFIDRTDENIRAYVEITFGEVLHNSIIKGKLISVTNASLESLDNSLSKVMLYAIQKERIATLQGNTRMQTLYYSFFERVVRFRYRNKEKNIKEICAALDNYVKNKVAIQSYVRQDDAFIVEYIPLSREEEYDINLNNNFFIEKSV